MRAAVNGHIFEFTLVAGECPANVAYEYFLERVYSTVSVFEAAARTMQECSRFGHGKKLPANRGADSFDLDAAAVGRGAMPGRWPWSSQFGAPGEAKRKDNQVRSLEPNGIRQHAHVHDSEREQN